MSKTNIDIDDRCLCIDHFREAARQRRSADWHLEPVFISSGVGTVVEIPQCDLCENVAFARVWLLDVQAQP